MKNINNELQKMSELTHKKTGYSIIHMVLECEDEMKDIPRFFKFNSNEWQIFIELIEYACNFK